MRDAFAYSNRTDGGVIGPIWVSENFVVNFDIRFWKVLQMQSFTQRLVKASLC